MRGNLRIIESWSEVPQGFELAGLLHPHFANLVVEVDPEIISIWLGMGFDVFVRKAYPPGSGLLDFRESGGDRALSND